MHNIRLLSRITIQLHLKFKNHEYPKSLLITAAVTAVALAVTQNVGLFTFTLARLAFRCTITFKETLA
jgi:hypothetical protein